MSDFARLMEMALASDPEAARKLMGEPPPPLMEQLEANWEAVDKANKEAAHHTHHAAAPAHPAPPPPAPNRDKR